MRLDYLGQIRIPIFKFLFASNNNLTCVKIGDTVPEDSIYRKFTLCNQAENVAGLKIDICFLVSYGTSSLTMVLDKHVYLVLKIPSLLAI